MAGVLRIYKLDLKPLHNDEGVNAFFFLRLFGAGFYRYDPANYHGPTLYYFTLISSSIKTLFFGEGSLNVTALRLVPALFGLGTIYLIVCLRKVLGTTAALAGASLLAVSPGAVYFSRDFIHESMFVFLTVAVVVAALNVYENASWTSGVVFSIVAALLFATKETAAISVGVLLLALAITVFWRSRTVPTKESSLAAFTSEFVERLGGPARATGLILGCAAVFVAVTIVFYSSFLDNYRAGLRDALTSLKLWTHTGTSSHRHPASTYFFWLGKEEWPLLSLGAAGTLIAAHRRNYFALFAGMWAFGLIAAYSLIPYKTPWLTFNFLAPLALASGYTVAQGCALLHSRNRVLSLVWTGLVLAVIAVSSYKALQLNFYGYDDDRYPYVYAQTRREFLDLVSKVNTLASGRGTGFDTSIAVMSPDYWPLPWYLRDYSRTGYYSRVTQNRTDIIIASAPQVSLLKPLLGSDYERIGEYPLRPGVNLVAFVRKSAATTK